MGPTARRILSQTYLSFVSQPLTVDQDNVAKTKALRIYTTVGKLLFALMVTLSYPLQYVLLSKPRAHPARNCILGIYRGVKRLALRKDASESGPRFWIKYVVITLGLLFFSWLIAYLVSNLVSSVLTAGHRVCCYWGCRLDNNLLHPARRDVLENQIR